MGDEDVDQVLDDFESTMNALDIGTIRMDRQRAEKLRAALNASGSAAPNGPAPSAAQAVASGGSSGPIAFQNMASKTAHLPVAVVNPFQAPQHSTLEVPIKGHNDQMAKDKDISMLQNQPPPPAAPTSPGPTNGALASAGASKLQQDGSSSMVLSNISRANSGGSNVNVTPQSPGPISTAPRANPNPLQSLFKGPPQSPDPRATPTPQSSQQHTYVSASGLTAPMQNGQFGSPMGVSPAPKMMTSSIGNSYSPQPKPAPGAKPVSALTQRLPDPSAVANSNSSSGPRESVFTGSASEGPNTQTQYFYVSSDGSLRSDSYSVYADASGVGIARATSGRESKVSKASKGSNGSKDSKHSKASKDSKGQTQEHQHQHQHQMIRSAPSSASANRLPMSFIAKYLGVKKLVRRPGESTSAAIHMTIHELLVAATELPGGSDVPLVQVTVTGTAIEAQQHPRTRHRGPPFRTQIFPVQYVSHAGQDAEYLRVMSIVFVSEVNARYTTCDCHVFCLPTEQLTRRLAFAVSLAFQNIARRVQMGEQLLMGVKLENPNSRAQSSSSKRLSNNTGGFSEDATEA